MLGRVPDLRVRVQVRILVICVSTSTSTSTWLLQEYESESEYWLTSTYMYEYEYRPMIHILYKPQYCIFQYLKRESSYSFKYGTTKLQLPIVHVNSLCQYISVELFYVIWHYGTSIDVLLAVMSPLRRQAIIWTYSDILLSIWPSEHTSVKSV